jgi:hypothetical protein
MFVLLLTIIVVLNTVSQSYSYFLNNAHRNIRVEKNIDSLKSLHFLPKITIGLSLYNLCNRYSLNFLSLKETRLNMGARNRAWAKGDLSDKDIFSDDNDSNG